MLMAQPVIPAFAACQAVCSKVIVVCAFFEPGLVPVCGNVCQVVCFVAGFFDGPP